MVDVTTALAGASGLLGGIVMVLLIVLVATRRGALARERCLDDNLAAAEGELQALRAAAGDGIALVSRVHPEWNVARVFGLLIGGQHRGQGAALRELARVEQLADGWRERAQKLAG